MVFRKSMFRERYAIIKGTLLLACINQKTPANFRIETNSIATRLIRVPLDYRRPHIVYLVAYQIVYS